jgi:ATP-binding cassette subfamily C protein
MTATTPPTILTTIRRIVALSTEGRWRWMALVPLALASAAAEATSAAALFGLIKIVEEPARAGSLPVARTLYAWLPSHDDRAVVLTFTVLLVVFYLVKNLLQILQTFANSRLVAEETAGLARRLFTIYVRAPYAFHLRRNSAELIRNVAYSAGVVFRSGMAPAVALVFETVVMVAIGAVLLVVAPAVTLVTAGLLAGAAAVFLRLSRRAVARWGRRSEQLMHQVLQNLQQTFGAVKEIKLLGRERYFSDAFDRAEQGLVRVEHLHTTLAAVPRVIVETLFVVGALVLVALVVMLGHTGPEVLPLLGLYAYAGFRIIPSANRIMLYVSLIRGAGAAVAQLFDDVRSTEALAEDESEGGVAPLPFFDRIELTGVGFAYEDGTPVLRDVDLTIQRGESIGVVGLTGAGKSTLTDLLLGLLAPTAGRITVDGRDLAAADGVARRGWQRRIGYVPQTIVLVDDTLRRNVALGIPDARIDEERLTAAVRVAQLEGFVASLPEGLGTSVGERGVRLSGGERQRVGIARALYRGPDVLVFDEATSALDNRTEADLVAALDTLPGPATRIIVAHRLGTVRACDRLVFLKDGRVDDVGPYDALVERNPTFRTIATRPEGR